MPPVLQLSLQSALGGAFVRRRIIVHLQLHHLRWRLFWCFPCCCRCCCCWSQFTGSITRKRSGENATQREIKLLRTLAALKTSIYFEFSFSRFCYLFLLFVFFFFGFLSSWCRGSLLFLLFDNYHRNAKCHRQVSEKKKTKKISGRTAGESSQRTNCLTRDELQIQHPHQRQHLNVP